MKLSISPLVNAATNFFEKAVNTATSTLAIASSLNGQKSTDKLVTFAQNLRSKTYQGAQNYWNSSSDSEKAKERFVAMTKPMLVGAASTACNLASNGPMIRQITRGAQIASLAWTAGKCVKAFFAPREAFVTRPDDQKKRDEMLQTLADAINPVQSAFETLKRAESKRPVDYGSINQHRKLVLTEIQTILSAILGRQVRVSNPDTCFKNYSSMQQFVLNLYTQLEAITKPTGSELKDPTEVIDAIKKALNELQKTGSIVTVDMDEKVESGLANLTEIVGRTIDVNHLNTTAHANEIDVAIQELKKARLGYLNALKPAAAKKKHWLVARYIDPVKTLISGQKETSNQGTTEAFAYLAFNDAIALFNKLVAFPVEGKSTQTENQERTGYTRRPSTPVTPVTPETPVNFNYDWYDSGEEDAQVESPHSEPENKRFKNLGASSSRWNNEPIHRESDMTNVSSSSYNASSNASR